MPSFLVEQEFSSATILCNMAEGRLAVLPATMPSGRPHGPRGPAPRTIQDLGEHQRQLLQRRWHALEPLTKLLGLPRESDYTLRSKIFAKR